MNYLKAVFWDYPEFTHPENLEKLLKESDEEVKDWILQRFMEHGRVVDTLNFFSVDIITEKITKLRLTPYTRRKWMRILEVYGHHRE